MRFLFMMFSVICYQVYAGTNDSFELLVKKTKNSEKAKIYNDWSDVCIQENNFERLKINAEKSLQLAEKYKNTTEKGRAYYYLGYLAYSENNIQQANFYYNKAIRLLSADKRNPDYLGKAYNACGVLYSTVGSNDSAIYYYSKALDIFRKTGNKEAEVRALNNIGTIWHNLSNYSKAEKYYLSALLLAMKINYTKGISTALFSLGLIAENQGDYHSALKYYLEASKLCETIKDLRLIAFSYLSIGNIYYYLGFYEKALNYYFLAENSYLQAANKMALVKTYISIGDCYSKLRKNAKSIEYYNKSLTIAQKEGFISDVATIYYLMANEFYLSGNHEKAMKYYLMANKIFEELGNIESSAGVFAQIGKICLDQKKPDEALRWLEKSQEIALSINDRTKIYENYLSMSECWQQKGNTDKALMYYKLYTSVKDSVFNEKNMASINELQTKYETEKKESEIKLLKQSNRIQELNLKKQKILRNSFVAGFLMVLLLALIIFKSLQMKMKDNKIIAAEKAKSEELLLNTLPIKVVNDLKNYGKTVPESFNDVTVYFSDVVGFTNMSTQLEPSFLISELNDIFTAFDDIMTRHSCERIKTIGDAYLAVCGMPEKNDRHAENIVNAAREILLYLHHRNQEKELKWKIRIGINSGRVVGGIVGVRKYIYDIFGDAVNTASRMESNSEPMRINVSENTYQLLKYQYNFIERPLLEVKGKGFMKMYFLA